MVLASETGVKGNFMETVGVLKQLCLQVYIISIHFFVFLNQNITFIFSQEWIKKKKFGILRKNAKKLCKFFY